jgi:hypothetical protein
MQVFVFSAAALVAVGNSAPAMAKKAPKEEHVITAMTAAEFDEQATSLRKQMRDGRFAGITVAERSTVERELDVISGLLQKSGAPEGMSDREKISLLNAQSNANAILTRNDDDRLVCEMRRPTGSNFKQKQCMTVKEARRLREQTRDGMDRYLNPGQPALDAPGTR